MLKSLRDEGVLFIGSGNMIHNLRLLHNGEPYDWTFECDTLLKEYIEKRDIDALLTVEKTSPLMRYAIPTDDHYRPCINTLALTEKNDQLFFFNDAIDLGSIGMRSFIAL